MLEAEGVRRIIVMTDEPAKYGRSARFADGSGLASRPPDEAQKLLRDTPA